MAARPGWRGLVAKAHGLSLLASGDRNPTPPPSGRSLTVVDRPTAVEAFRKLSDQGNEGLPETFFRWASAEGIEMTVQQVNSLASQVQHMLEQRGSASFEIGRSSSLYKDEPSTDA